jgi:hypothetical protein
VERIVDFVSMGWARECILAWFLSTWVFAENDSTQTCKRGPCVTAHLAVPRNGAWFFGPSSKFEGVVLVSNLTVKTEYHFEVFLDGISIVNGNVVVAPSTLTSESDVNFDIEMLSATTHTLRFVVYEADKTTQVASSQNKFEVLEPPRVILTFPKQNQRFECPDAAGVTIFFTYDLTYELSADFLEAGAGFLGAAAYVDGRRDTCALQHASLPQLQIFNLFKLD